MSMVIVPNYLAAELNRLLDAEIEKHPAAEKDREVLYSQLLAYVDEHGVIPDFSLARNKP
jgi:hypothetical protein